jgi:hypothetical protein
VLPNAMFSDQKSQIGKILEGLAMEDGGIFMSFLSILHMAKWYILWQFGTVCGQLVYVFCPFW